MKIGQVFYDTEQGKYLKVDKDANDDCGGCFYDLGGKECKTILCKNAIYSIVFAEATPAEIKAYREAQGLPEKERHDEPEQTY